MPSGKKPGRQEDQRRAEYLRRFGITLFRPYRRITKEFMDQLDKCYSDAERRLLIGHDGRNE